MEYGQPLFVVNLFFERTYVRLTAVKRKSMRNALVPGPGRGSFPRGILIETIAETVVRQNIVGFLMTSPKIKLKNYRSYLDFTFMMH